MKDKYVWVRIGDSSEYEKYDSVEEALDALQSIPVHSPLMWRVAGFETLELSGEDYVSIYWGDEEASPTRELDKREKKLLDEALDPCLDEHRTVREDA